MITLQNIRKSFASKEILTGINLTVEQGDVAVIIGPSGTGKTTLLRCMNGLEKADEGNITIDQVFYDYKKSSKKQLLALRRKTAMVFQNYNLFKNKTALENITEGLITVQKIPKTDAVITAKQQLKGVGLEGKEDFYPNQLSGGQQQRVGIARALALNPSVILFDEPTSSLDPELVGEVLSVMKQVANRGITMVVVTHEMSFAQNIANKVIFMEGGNVVEQGSPKEVFSSPKEAATKRFLDCIYQPFVYQI
ncbi:MAG: amino acid ABC transporter ATP-binding protein [Clostridium sp.]|uniref:amino acid ABC transporter ATP-binding protein n=1 Tax=Clostridium sp. TaxID=1506 RepID=UPI002910AA9A|nr:amino acid ABC transporter ATP-binding protein [Clostridium sp.]MDU7336886.1 amino acid ABC transporter ATP-binding protein [Clostridium sp.]